MNKEPITLHLETFNDKEYILADECIKAIGIHRKTNNKLHKEIERLNNIIDKINKLYDCNTHCENIYHAIGVVLNKEYCDIEDVLEEDLLEILKGSDKE